MIPLGLPQRRTPLRTASALVVGLTVGWLLAPPDWCGQAPGATDVGRTFYVDAQAGRDGNDGLASDRAWQSLQRVNNAELKPGDTVRFRCGATWRGFLVPISGSEDAPILQFPWPGPQT